MHGAIAWCNKLTVTCRESLKKLKGIEKLEEKEKQDDLNAFFRLTNRLEVCYNAC